MSTDVNTVAEPSAATTPIQFDSWDEKGNPIVSKKETPKSEEPAASAPTAKESESEPKGKTAAEPEAAPSQEKKERKPGEKLSLDEEVGKLRKELREAKAKLEERERSREPEPKPASEAKTEQPKQPPTYSEWRKTFKPSEWMKQWATEHQDQSYEDAVAALGDFQAEMRAQYENLERLRQEGRRKSQEMLRQTLEKYPDAETKVKEVAKAIQSPEVPAFIRDFIDDSDVMTDLLYTLADKSLLENLLETAKTRPAKALRVIRDMELDITKAVSKEPKAEKETEPPADPKPRAPKPPVEVGGRGTGSENPSMEAARSGSFAAFEKAEWAKRRA